MLTGLETAAHQVTETNPSGNANNRPAPEGKWPREKQHAPHEGSQAKYSSSEEQSRQPPREQPLLQALTRLKLAMHGGRDASTRPCMHIRSTKLGLSKKFR